MESDDVLLHCRRSSHFLHSWLERGEGSDVIVEKVLTDSVVRSRLEKLLDYFSEAAVDSDVAAAPPAEFSSLISKVKETLGITEAAAKNLLKIYVDDKLGSFQVLHYAGSIFDLIDLPDDQSSTLEELRALLHAEQVRSLEAVSCILRHAHDEGHPFSSQCKKLAATLLSEGLADRLLQTFERQSTMQTVLAGMTHDPHAVLRSLRESLELQRCALECLLVANYDLSLCAATPQSPEKIQQRYEKMLDLFMQQRFLGSLSAAAREQSWVLGHGDLCSLAQCVGDLSMALLIEGLDLERLVPPVSDAAATVEAHPLLCDASFVKHIHMSMCGSWVSACEIALEWIKQGKEQPPFDRHLAKMASVVLLGWSAMLAGLPQYCESKGISLDRLMGSPALKASRLFEEGIEDVITRGFLTADGFRASDHRAARSVLRGFIATVCAVFDLDRAMPGGLTCLSHLMVEVHHPDAGGTKLEHFWTLEYPKRQGCFHVLHSWLEHFPIDLPELLDLTGSLCGSSENEQHANLVVQLIQSPIRSLLLPHAATRDVVHAHNVARGVQLSRAVYGEELCLRIFDLELPEYYLQDAAVLPEGNPGTLLDRHPGRGRSEAFIRWELRSTAQIPGAWRLALAAWDSGLLLVSADRTLSESARRLTCAAARFACNLVIASPSAFLALGDGILERLYASIFAASVLDTSRPPSLLPLLLRALSAAVRPEGYRDKSSSKDSEESPEVCPLHAPLLQLLEGRKTSRFRIGGAQDLVALFARKLDDEKAGIENQVGLFPTTLAALEFCESFLGASPVELLSLPPFEAIESKTPRGLETVQRLLYFSLGACLGQIQYWPFRSPADRWTLCASCVRCAAALLPALHCFNWPLPPSLASPTETPAPGTGTASTISALGGLRKMQMQILQIFSDCSFVPLLLKCIALEVVFAPAHAKSAGRCFLGFRNAVLEEGPLAPEEASSTHRGHHQVAAERLIADALECLHGLLTLVMRPDDINPQYDPLTQHLLEWTTLRTVLSSADSSPSTAAGHTPNSGSASSVPRADLVQTLYAYACGQGTQGTPEVVCWAARTLAVVCIFWRHSENAGFFSGVPCGALTRVLKAQDDVHSRPLLLAYLSVPPHVFDGSSSQEAQEPEKDARPVLLSEHLCQQLLNFIPDSKRSVELRLAFMDLCSACLGTQPSMFQDEAGELVPKMVAACGSVLVEATAMLKEVRSDSDAMQLLHEALGLLSDIAGAFPLSITSCFSKVVEPQSGAKGKQHPTTWHALAAIAQEVLVPWARGVQPDDKRQRTSYQITRPFDLHLHATALLHLSAHGCGAAESIQKNSSEANKGVEILIEALMGPEGLSMWLPPSDAALEAAPRPFRSKWESRSQAKLRAPREILWPEISCRTSADALHALLAKLQIRIEFLSSSVYQNFNKFQTRRNRNNVAGTSLGSALYLPDGLQGLSEAIEKQAQGAQQGGGDIGPAWKWGTDLWALVCGSMASGLGSVQAETGTYDMLMGLRLLARGERAMEAGSKSSAGSEIFGVHSASARLVAARALMERDTLQEVTEDLKEVTVRCQEMSRAGVSVSKKLAALQAFDGLVRAITKRVQGKTDQDALRKLVEPVLPRLAQYLQQVLKSLELLSDHAAFFGRIIALFGHMLAFMRSYSGTKTSLPVDTQEVLKVVEMETPLGLTLLKQLIGVLRACHKSMMRVILNRKLWTGDSYGGTIFAGVSFWGAHTDVVLATSTLLLLIVPAMRHKKNAASVEASGERNEKRIEAAPDLIDLIQILSQLLECIKPSISTKELANLPKDPLLTTASPFWKRPRLAGSDATERSDTTYIVDSVLRNSLSSVVLTLIERTLAILCESQQPTGGRGGVARMSTAGLQVLEQDLLPRILGHSGIISPASFMPQPSGGTMPSSVVPGGAFAVEAAQAQLLDSVLLALLGIARTPSGVRLLVEQRAFVHLAHTPCLREAILPRSNGSFPDAYTVPGGYASVHLLAQGNGIGVPWRRPLHASWVRTLLLAAAVLDSAPQTSSDVQGFLEAFELRLHFVFRQGVQSGQMALLEEGAAVAKVLSFLPGHASFTQRLLADASSQALAFAIGICLVDRTSPSEVLLPVSASERVAAGISSDEAAPAVVPSVFHQRAVYLALDLFRSLLKALLKLPFAPGSFGNLDLSAAAWDSQQLYANSGMAHISDPHRNWTMAMDVVLEGARRVAEYLENLQENAQDAALLVIAREGSKEMLLFDNAQDQSLELPLALGLAPSEPVAPDKATLASSPLLSPKIGASPPHSPKTPGRRKSRIGSGSSSSGRMYQRLVARPKWSFGGQVALGVIPEVVTVSDLKKLLGLILEMSCALLCLFCQASGSTVKNRSAPSALTAVLHGLLNFLHEMRLSPLFVAEGLQPSTRKFLSELDKRLREGQNLGAPGSEDDDGVDGEPWS